jgi:hypothetical protein
VSRLEDATRQAVADLEDLAAARYALVGGLAVSARAEPRLTRDEDIEVARESVALVRARGFHRSKDLASELERMLASR